MVSCTTDHFSIIRQPPSFGKGHEEGAPNNASFKFCHSFATGSLFISLGLLFQQAGGLSEKMRILEFISNILSGLFEEEIFLFVPPPVLHVSADICFALEESS